MPFVNGPPPPRLCPPGVCDCCGWFAFALHQVGSMTEPGMRCPKDCGGYVRHRGLWSFWWCPACGGDGCDGCSWKGIVATPAE